MFSDGAVTCDSNILAYIVWLALMITFKGIQPIGYVWHWLYRRKRRGGKPARSVSGRYPIIATASMTLFLLYLCFAATTSTGVCNSTNGCPLALFTSLWVMSSIQTTFFLLFFINLGQRIIPMSRKGALLDSSESNSNEHHRDDTSKVESFQKVCIVVQYLSLFAVWIVGAPLAVTLGSGGNLNLYITLVFVFQFIYYAAFLTPLLNQLHRLIKVVKLAMIASPSKTWAIEVIGKMRRIEVVLFIIVMAVEVVTILIVFRVIQPRWYIILMLYNAELCSSSFGFFAFVTGPFLKYWQGKKAQKKQQVANALTDETGTRGIDQRTVNLSSAANRSIDLRKKDILVPSNINATEDV
jgi:hypothetical protein